MSTPRTSHPDVADGADTDDGVGAGGPEDRDPDVGVVDEDRGRGGLSWGRAAVLGVALAFLGVAVGVFATRDRPPASDSVDVGFLQDMITHHDQALQMATMTVTYGEDPVVRSYAREVLTFQSFEIGVMTQMLDDWGYSRADRSDEAMGWMGMAVPVDDMPGLLSDEQIARFDDLRGAELDAAFLELMSEHHRGGLHMAEDAARRADDDDLAALAARMERNQTGEITEYRLRAEELGFDLDIRPPSVPPDDLPAVDPDGEG